MTPTKPICPTCKVEMARAGFGWSGGYLYKRYHCHGCGKQITPTKGEYSIRVEKKEGTK